MEYHNRIRFNFREVGQTRFPPEKKFGLFRQDEAKSTHDTIEDVADIIKKSIPLTKRNSAVIIDERVFEECIFLQYFYDINNTYKTHMSLSYAGQKFKEWFRDGDITCNGMWLGRVRGQKIRRKRIGRCERRYIPQQSKYRICR